MIRIIDTFSICIIPMDLRRPLRLSRNQLLGLFFIGLSLCLRFLGKDIQLTELL